MDIFEVLNGTPLYGRPDDLPINKKHSPELREHFKAIAKRIFG